MKKHLTALGLVLLWAASTFAQKEFFRSQQAFTKEQLNKFFSSVAIHDSLVLFNANDYYLYAYNKNNGLLKWRYNTVYKTTVPVFVQNNIVYAPTYVNETEQTSQLNVADGTLIRHLPFGPLNTKPVIKNGIFYGTAIYDGGRIIAYDLKKDTVVWSRFIAHGTSTQPFYLADKIVANAEGDNWVELGYDGALLDTACAVKAAIFVENIPCIKKFKTLSHDGLEINESLLDKLFNATTYGAAHIISSKKFTYLFFEDKLSILSGKLKQKQQIQVAALTGLELDNYAKLLKADDENIWLLYGNHLWQYNHKTKKTIRLTDLNAWEPRDILIDNENIWLISGKDGLLYGLTLL